MSPPPSLKHESDRELCSQILVTLEAPVPGPEYPQSTSDWIWRIYNLMARFEIRQRGVDKKLEFEK